MKIVGHEPVIQAISQNDYKSILLSGPYSVGKMTILKEKAYQLNRPISFLAHKIDASGMEELREFSFRKGSTIILRLDTMKQNEIDKLLKIIEDSEDSVRFYCTTVNPIPDTLRSRFVSFDLGYLSNSQVAQILKDIGHDHDKSERLSELSYGQVIPTIRAAETNVKTTVMLALKHLNEHDEDALDTLYSRWEQKDTDNLIQMCTETLTGRNRIFTKEESDMLSKKLALKILRSADRRTSPRFMIRSTLANIAREMNT